ncbi:MAG: FAD:protein FMN transferase [Sulfurimonas sp.]|uniref:FAD:protein FMN transferase n=1 Tax=Sulfurimonas sp. TaxID=2022749 RepID=UPI0026299731|nr:FAD:protein FMN transferase [Sulfurimonas sp.]MCW8894467.1 FAD:protein FMN transferase [Sulfurimonas sp.]MCW8954083.1 FAD:protein FMN transferase [Sulfurimonas sp.]MCW9068165.1 FAD:protein FMN transferase [Sulfurimonas sp.]
MFRNLFFIVVLALSLEAKTLSRTQVIMSTFVTISVDEKDKNYIEDGFDIIKDVDLSLSSYNPKAKIFLLNKNRHVELDNYSLEALKLSQKYYIKSDGYFDITIGSITKDLYRFGEAERLVSIQELKSAKVDFKGLHVQNNKASLDAGIKVDLGGMGKGFAVDKVAQFFRNSGVKNATISASGDIRCLSTCSIDVQDPFGEGILLSFETAKKDLGITTSGNYNRYVESTKNNHLINPKLKQSQTKFISITLIGDMSNSDLDAYATASSVMPMEKAYEFLERIGAGYIVLQSDKNLVVSKNISKYVTNLLFNNAAKKQP